MSETKHKSFNQLERLNYKQLLILQNIVKSKKSLKSNKNSKYKRNRIAYQKENLWDVHRAQIWKIKNNRYLINKLKTIRTLIRKKYVRIKIIMYFLINKIQH